MPPAELPLRRGVKGPIIDYWIRPAAVLVPDAIGETPTGDVAMAVLAIALIRFFWTNRGGRWPAHRLHGP